MIQVVADKNWSLYKKGEVVTKFNSAGEHRLECAILHSLSVLKFTGTRTEDGKSIVRDGYEKNPAYAETVELYLSLFGRLPDGHDFIN